MPRNPLVRALGLAALILFGVFAQTLHESTEIHAVCPEHGELVHVEHAASGATSAAHEHGFEECEQEAGSRVDPWEQGVAHDHCGLAHFLRSGSSPWIAAPAGFVEIVTVEVTRIAGAHERVGAIPTLAFAPKHSPPARAA